MAGRTLYFFPIIVLVLILILVLVAMAIILPIRVPVARYPDAEYQRCSEGDRLVSALTRIVMPNWLSSRQDARFWLRT